MQKIKQVSFVLRLLFTAAFIALPVYVMTYWISGGHPFGVQFPIAVFGYDGPNLPPVSTLTTSLKTLGFFINLIPVAFYMTILGLLIHLFKLYEKSEIFTKNNVKTIRNIGFAMLLNKAVCPFFGFLLSYTLTQSNPPGYRFAYLGISIQDISIMVIAVLIILISWIMAEAYKLQEEQQYTV